MAEKQCETAIKYDDGKPAYELLDFGVLRALPVADFRDVETVVEIVDGWARGAPASGQLELALSHIAYLLCPDSPMLALRREIARVLELGARKYAPHNWRKGMAWSRLIGAALRHLDAHAGGMVTHDEYAPDGTFLGTMTHLGSAACCLMFLIAYERDGVGTDDRWMSG